MMRSRLFIPVLSMFLLAHAGLLQAAAPVGDTIWLYSIDTGFYVEMDPGRDNALIALSSPTVAANEQFIVEDAGSDNILLKSAANSMYARADTSTTSNILRAETTSTTDPNVLFKWIENGDGTISFRNASLGKYVKVQGVNKYLKVTRATIEPDTKFMWGVVGPPVIDTD
ncbi:MAG: RICIN domain-containing protein, partial [Planctomycetes bacterium]|nr:RICIN domain-containing protein [Planctomycetota bacterium]